MRLWRARADERRAGKRGPAQQLSVLVAQCLSLVGMRWRLATCGRSQVSACRAEQSRQAEARPSSHVRLPPSITQAHTILIEPRTVAPALHVRRARSSWTSTCEHCPPTGGHLLPYGRMITSTGDLPSCQKSIEPACHSLPGCIGSYSLASSVRDISDPPPPLGLARIWASNLAPRSFTCQLRHFKLHPVALTRTTFFNTLNIFG